MNIEEIREYCLAKPEVTPAYHFNKQHWNGIKLNGGIGDNQMKEWIDQSYTLVVDSLPHRS